MDVKNLVIFLGGEQGSGKSTSGTFIYDRLMSCNYFIPMNAVKFAGLLYQMQETVEGGPITKKNGPFLQKVGDAVREEYGLDYLVKNTKKQILNFLKRPNQHQGAAIVIDDVRKELELSLAKDLRAEGIDTVSIYLSCPEEIRKARSGDLWRPNTKHNTEAELATIARLFDYTVDTSGTMEERNAELSKILASKGISYDPQMEAQNLIEGFNMALRSWENASGCRANFSWSYDESGRKLMKLSECTPYVTPDKEELDQHAKAVSDLLPKLEPFDGNQV